MHKTLDGAKCRWKSADGSVCEWTQKSDRSGGVSTSNLQKHIDSKHGLDKANYENFQVLVAKYNKAKMESDQEGGKKSILQYMTQPRKDVKPYQSSSLADLSRKTSLNLRLAAWVGGNPHVAYAVVDQQRFAEFIRELEPRYELPSRWTISNNVKKLGSAVRSKLKEFIGRQERVSLGIDVWTDKAGNAYLGVHFQVYDFDAGAIRSGILGVLPVPGDHTGANLMDVLYSFWTDKMGGRFDQIFAIGSDNASNLVHGIKVQLARLALEEFLVTKEQQVAHDDDEEILEMAGGSLDEQLRTFEAGDDQLVSLMANASVEDAQDIMQNPVDQISDYEEMEAALLEKCGNLRKRCVLHTLQLSVIKGKAVDKMRQLFGDLNAFVSKIRGKKPGRKLKEVAGVVLVRHVPTRWTSDLQMVNRLLLAKPHLPPILEACRIQPLDLAVWDVLLDIKSLLDPFADFTEQLQAEDVSLVGKLIPIVSCLLAHLGVFRVTHSADDEEMRTAVYGMRDAMKADMEIRFKFMSEPDSPTFDPFYMACTFGDLRYRNSLDNDTQGKAIEWLCKQLDPARKGQTGFEGEDQGEDEGQGAGDSGDGQGSQPPPAKVSRADQLMASLLGNPAGSSAAPKSARKKQTASDFHEIRNKISRQLNAYKTEEDVIDQSQDPLKFWNSPASHRKYPKIWEFMCQMLSVPAGTASVCSL
jgi:hypothetical protein